MAFLWRLYLRELEARPLVTKCWMSAVVLGTADMGAQRLQHMSDETERRAVRGAPPQPFELDLKRALGVQMYAVAFQGPFGHAWYPLLQKVATRLTLVAPALLIPVKVFFDEVINGNISNALYFSAIPLVEGRPLPWIKEKIRWDLLPTFLSEAALWVPCSTINFLYVPLRHQLLFANCTLFVWTTVLSVICHDDTVMRSFDCVNPFLTDEEKRRGMPLAPASPPACLPERAGGQPERAVGDADR